MARISFTIILILSCLGITHAQDIWTRPVIIGASLSDGYDHLERLGGPRSDALALDIPLKKSLKSPTNKLPNFSNRFLFVHPIGISHKQIADAIASKPSVIIAVDQLFWQLYGNFSSPAQRLITFKAALTKLDPITCPLVIGNIPDASPSLNKMLSASQIPNIETINQANLLLTQWVAKRKQTSIVDLSKFMDLCVHNKEVKLKHITYPEGTTRSFLQADMLHPTHQGIKAMSYAVLDALQAISDLKDSDINLPSQPTSLTPTP